MLRTPAELVVDFDKELRQLVKDLQETMLDAPGVGLAAPQVGTDGVVEKSGVAVNSKGHVFVFSRGNSTGNGDGITATCGEEPKRGWERRWEHSIIVVDGEGNLVDGGPVHALMWTVGAPSANTAPTVSLTATSATTIKPGGYSSPIGQRPPPMCC